MNQLVKSVPTAFMLYWMEIDRALSVFSADNPEFQAIDYI